MKQKIIRYVILVCFSIVIIPFVVNGITSFPSEYDSVSYHIPLAKSIINGTIFHPNKLNFPNSSFPASSEIILAMFIILHIPLNLYNILGLGILFFLTYLFARRISSTHNAIYLAVAVCTLPPVVRLLLTQTVDIWLTIFFVWTYYLLLKPKNSVIYFLLLGLSSGFLIGSKYSGPLFFIVLLLIYGGKIYKSITFKNILYFLIPFGIFGLFWYIRNIIIYKNPYYPAPLFWFPGKKEFLPNVFLSHLSMMLQTPSGFYYTTSAFLSEFLYWPIIGAIVLGLSRTLNTYKDNLYKVKDTLILIATGFAIYLIIPGYAYNYNNYVSEMRYILPVIFVIITLVYKLLTYINESSLFSLLVIFNLVSIITLFYWGSYHPKVIVLGVVILFIFMIIRDLKRA